MGTAASGERRLTAATESRLHCAIRVTPRGLELRDLGSSNGTSLDGHEVERIFHRTNRQRITARELIDAAALPFRERWPARALACSGPDDHAGALALDGDPIWLRRARRAGRTGRAPRAAPGRVRDAAGHGGSCPRATWPRCPW